MCSVVSARGNLAGKPYSVTHGAIGHVTDGASTGALAGPGPKISKRLGYE